jgi:hypothetical protein
MFAFGMKMDEQRFEAARPKQATAFTSKIISCSLYLFHGDLLLISLFEFNKK